MNPKKSIQISINSSFLLASSERERLKDLNVTVGFFSKTSHMDSKFLIDLWWLEMKGPLL